MKSLSVTIQIKAIEQYFPPTGSSVGKVPDYRAEGRGFKPRPDQKPGSLNNC